MNKVVCKVCNMEVCLHTQAAIQEINFKLQLAEDVAEAAQEMEEAEDEAVSAVTVAQETASRRRMTAAKINLQGALKVRKEAKG